MIDPGERVAIVGAGISGLACARTLLDRGVDVTVFDKGRSAGGRLASHRSDELAADLGAQYFTVHDERFGRFVRSWIDDGVVARWDGRIRALSGGAVVDTPPTDRFVGTPSMSSIARHLAADVGVHASHRVDRIERRGARFGLAGTIGAAGVTVAPRDDADRQPLVDLGEFDVVVVCLPSDQAEPLVRSVSPTLADTVARVTCDPCLALGFATTSDALREVPLDGLFIGRDGDVGRIVAWLSRDSSKPGRRDTESWVIHADPTWSRAHLRDPQGAIEHALLGELARLLDVPPFAAKATTLRRWAFARAPSPLDIEALFDDDARIGVGGDWAAGGRVEGAFLSGVVLAGRVLGLS